MFQMSLLFTIPYAKLHEPFYAYTDNDQGLMTLNYYSGQDIYYFSGVENGTQKFYCPYMISKFALIWLQRAQDSLPPLFPI